jgi:ubiquinone/menaquinone biosynthesis C-methylase UbiE
MKVCDSAMKVRESGMPDEVTWAGFFDADAALDELIGREDVAGDLVEFGCGYGTFTVPVALRTQGIVTALDIEQEMVDCVREKAKVLGLANIRCELRDFIAEGTGLADASQAHVMIFNLLHLERPVGLLREARRILREGGRVSVMHWRSDVPTPRGPALAMRPSAEQCRAWMTAADFRSVESVDLGDCCPYHFGLIGVR